MSCPLNTGLTKCLPGDMKCNKCGWNPKVAKVRLARLHGELNIENGGVISDEAEPERKEGVEDMRQPEVE